jgi:hypothetical protein
VAAARSPTASVVRAVALATAAVLVAANCGGSGSHYVSNKAAQAYFKVPKGWDVESVTPVLPEFLINDNSWAVFFTPKGLDREAAAKDPMNAPGPVGLALIGQLEQGSYDAVGDADLRAISLIDAANETRILDPLQLLISQDDDLVELLKFDRIAEDGLRGYRMRYKLMPPGSQLLYDRAVMIHDATHTYYSFTVSCSVLCFEKYLDDIDTFFDSLRVRRDQP